MRRGIMALAIVAGMSSIVPSSAGAASATNDAAVSRAISANWYNPTGNGYTAGWLAAVQLARGTQAGATATPSLTFEAQANLFQVVYNPYSVSVVSFPTQVVSPTAVSMDPIGNSARITACLTPSPSGPCQTFDLTLSRPNGTQVGTACGSLSSFSCVNAWFDPSTNVISARANTQVFLYRYNYVVAGTVPTGPVPVNSGGGTFTNVATLSETLAP